MAMIVSGEATYLIVNLSGGPFAPPRIDFSNAPPPGGWTDEFKIDKMVFRRIQAGVFIMGSPEDEIGRENGENQHEVTLTKDFYIGVFQITQWHWYQIMGTWPSYFNNIAFRDTRPVEQVSYSMIRGSEAGSYWPASNEVDPNSFMGKLRTRTGMVFDLPTESQWEFAARAGTTTALNSNKNLTHTGACTNMARVGRYEHNHPGGYSSNRTVGLDRGTARVGSYLPNEWGLYDMHGNVFEWCLDWFSILPAAPVTDPVGPTSGSARVMRGGSWFDYAPCCRSAYRYRNFPDYAQSDVGFRAIVFVTPPMH